MHAILTLASTRHWRGNLSSAWDSKIASSNRGLMSVSTWTLTTAVASGCRVQAEVQARLREPPGVSVVGWLLQFVV